MRYNPVTNRVTSTPVTAHNQVWFPSCIYRQYMYIVGKYIIYLYDL
jgi:hypothetical protein